MFRGILLFWIAMASFLAAAEKAPIPERLSCSIGGGIFGPSYKVELVDRTLHYSVRDGEKEKTEKVTPTAEQWAEFRKTLDAIDAWHWSKRYNSPALDGTQWAASIAYKGRKVESSGSNKYPGRTRGFPYSKEFTDYLAAMKKLLGGREFR